MKKYNNNICKLKTIVSLYLGISFSFTAIAATIPQAGDNPIVIDQLATTDNITFLVEAYMPIDNVRDDIDVFIDGERQGIFSAYANVFPSRENSQPKVFEAAGLGHSTHTFKLVPEVDPTC